MGVETGIALGSTLIGGAMQYGENRAARKRATKASDEAKAVAGAGPSEAERLIYSTLVPQLNQGQDSFLQYLRAKPGALDPFMYDQSKMFEGLKAQDTQTINDQVAGLRASAGSLGSRFGSGFAAREGMTRERFASDIGARNAGISQNAFNFAVTSGMQDYGQTASINQNRLGLLFQALNTGVSADTNRRQQMLSAIGMGAGIPMPSAGAAIGQTGVDIAQLLMLSKFLGNKSSGTPPAPAGNNVPIPGRVIYNTPYNNT